MKLPVIFTSVLASLCFASVAGQAAPISWTDWTGSSAGQVDGTLVADGDAVSVTYTGDFSFAQTSGGTNFWVPDVYSSNPTIDNPPPNSDIIALSTAGTKTVTFSKAILNPILALVSWNSQSVDFGTPIEILGTGRGYWGNGTAFLNSGGTGFTSSGEVHGAIRLLGSFSSITFTDVNNESWHGFTIGVEGLGTPVPAPGALALLGLGLMGLGLRRRNQR